MTDIFVKAFAGERPKVDPRHLPNEYSQVAQGCHFYHGNLTPLRKPLLTGDEVGVNTKTIFKYLDQYWFSWNTEVNAVNSPIANDPWQRVYFTGDGYPKVTSNTIFSGLNMPAVAYKLGVHAPENTISISVVNPTPPQNPTPSEGEVAASATDVETRFYTHTYVTEHGEEGMPGSATDVEILDPDHEDTVVTLTFQPPNHNLQNITRRRVYRTSTGGGIADFLLVADMGISTTTWVDNVKGDYLGAPLDTYDYNTPPSDMKGLCSMANGILAGFSGNTQCFSESFLPYAWPKPYRMTTEHNIVANVAVGNSVIALTEGFPYIFSGVSPDAISSNKIESNQACVNARSAVLVKGAVIYASPDGLVQLTGNSTATLTESIMTREQWQSLKPETIEAYSQEGRYLAFYGTNLDNAFIFDPETGDFRHIAETADTGFVSLLDDALYICSQGKISEWEASTELMEFKWRSKEYRLSDASLSCAMVKGDDLSLTGLRIFANKNEVLHIAPGGLPEQAFRLPSDRGNYWEFELYGKGEVESVIISDSMNSIRRLSNG